MKTEMCLLLYGKQRRFTINRIVLVSFSLTRTPREETR